MKRTFTSLLILMMPVLAEPIFARGVIDQVEFEGVTQLTQDELEESLEITPGERFNNKDVKKTKENLVSVYRRKGYFSASVTGKFRTERSNNRRVGIFTFRVSEGSPTKIRKLLLSFVSGAQPKKGVDLMKLEETVRNSVDFEEGSVLSNDLIESLKRNVEGELANEDYFNAKVVSLNFETAQKTPGAAGDWVNLMFRARIGKKVIFGIRGNKRLTVSELKEFIQDQRQLGLGSSYVRTIEDRLIKEYKALGHFGAKIESKTFEYPERGERRISFLIDEGERFKISSLRFDGNYSFSNDDLVDQFVQLSPELVSRDIFVEKDVDATAELVLDWIKSNGYLSAKVITIDKKIERSSNTVALTIYVYEGEQTFVRDFRIDGNKALKKEEVSEILGVQKDKPLNLFAFSEGLDNLKTAYRDKGHLDVEILNERTDTIVKYFQKNRLADISIKLREGPQYRVSDILIEGLQKTDREIVTRELTFKVDQVLEEKLVAESEANLRKLGVFSNVSTQYRTDPRKPGFKQVRIVLKEASRIRVAVGLGIRNDLGIRSFVEGSYANLWKQNHTWTATGDVNRRLENFRFFEYQLQTGYVWPWFALERLFFRPSLTFQRRQFFQFDADTLGLDLNFERTVWSKINLVAGLTYSLERIRQFNADQSIDNQDIRIGSITPSLRVDLRDNPLTPRKGAFFSASYELAVPELGSQSDPFPVGYTRFQFRADGFIPIIGRTRWFLSFRTGFARNLINPDDYPDVADNIALPLIKQFALGGANSLRGYQIQELNVQDVAVRGTLSYVNYRTQVDMPLTENMTFGPFLDAANLLVDEFSFGALKYGAGIGLHYQTPVGPVNFDLGVKLNPEPNTDRTRFHFTVGIL